MNTKYILHHNGYDKLIPYLPDYQKGVIDGMKEALSYVDTFFDNLSFGKDNESLIEQMKLEVIAESFETFKTWLDTYTDDICISFIENNHYSIDLNGEVVDDNEESD